MIYSNYSILIVSFKADVGIKINLNEGFLGFFFIVYKKYLQNTLVYLNLKKKNLK